MKGIKMVEIITFDTALKEAEEYSSKHLLLGNGFSIAYKYDIFTYGSLLDEADFSSLPELRKVFDAMGTVDFEEVIRALQSSATILEQYGLKSKLVTKLVSDAETLKTILVQTIAKKHPEGPFDITEEQYVKVRRFLANFIGEDKRTGNVYTLNYDLLLYWAVMHDENSESKEKCTSIFKNDGFGKEEGNEDADYVIWHGETAAHSQRIHYLHGALHLFDAGKELKKFTWINTGKRLIEQSREAMDNNMFPLFVAEGNSDQKLEKIKHSGFLYHSYKSFARSMDNSKSCLFLYGHSLAPNDFHILTKISHGKIPKLFISIYGDINIESNKQIVQAANMLIEERKQLNEKYPLEVIYYDASSANVWE
jgi:hypothetical protein